MYAFRENAELARVSAERGKGVGVMDVGELGLYGLKDENNVSGGYGKEKEVDKKGREG